MGSGALCKGNDIGFILLRGFRIGGYDVMGGEATSTNLLPLIVFFVSYVGSSSGLVSLRIAISAFSPCVSLRVFAGSIRASIVG